MTALRNPSQVKSYNDNFFRKNLSIPEIHQKDPAADLRIAREQAREICNEIFENLDEFPYVYFTDGVTGCLNYLLPGEPIHIRKGEYRYVLGFPNVTYDIKDSAYFWYPFSYNGKFGNLEELCHGRTRVILDCSYMFASNLNSDKFIPGCVSEVAFGVSKSHNLHDARVGWFFSKKKIPTFHVLQYEYGYASAMYSIVLNSISSAPANFLYQKYKSEFSQLYSNNNLIEGDTNLFALDSAGNRIMHYEINT